MDCVNCGAPLPAKSMICRHCETLNDVDLRAIGATSGTDIHSDRDCPRCDVPLHSVNLGVDGGFHIDRCQRCLGIFFDPGELERILKDSVSGVFEVDLRRLDVLVDEEYQQETRQVRYVECPVCGKLMHRRNYGARSGVVIDSCRNHGLWLDGGELGQILKWTKAGGKIHDAESKVRLAEVEDRKKRVARRAQDARHEGFGRDYQSGGSDADLLDLIMNCLSIFRGGS